MNSSKDGPSSSCFTPILFKGNMALSDLKDIGVSDQMVKSVTHAPSGQCVSWGIPFDVGDIIAIRDKPVTIEFSPVAAHWLVFMHTSDIRHVEPNSFGFTSPMRGEGQLAEYASDYVLLYRDGTEKCFPIHRRFQIGAFQRRWGENCFEAVPHHKPHPIRPPHEQLGPGWGFAQTRGSSADEGPWMNWLWALENPCPEKTIVGMRFEPHRGVVVIMAISAGDVSSHPLRWETRRKAMLTLPQGESFQPDLDEHGLLKQIQIDLGQIISANLRHLYPNERWTETYNNMLPVRFDQQLIIEYTAHPDACFHLSDDSVIPVQNVSEGMRGEYVIQSIKPSNRRIILRAIEQETGRSVPVKLHIHGEWDEYLAPVDRHRLPNSAWFEDYSVDFVHGGKWDGKGINTHNCTYIPGETTIDLPQGKVFIEVSKGFEIQPVRKIVEVTPSTEEIVIAIEHILPWRRKGWVTADTHVHFLSPISALLEGSAEGVNVVNLLASQWGELMTNVGDFDGITTWGSKEAGGDGEYLVRVGTENRQHVLGHISLLGYNGRIIAPMTTGGLDESALGDPIEILLTEWARQCKHQNGLVILPHFPQPRAEHAASIISGDVDALEMTAWEDLYGGIDPYSLSDWYRYLNCGYFVAAVGGTDKMSSNTAIGTVRTYALIPPDKPFTYENWKEAVRHGETFVTYGPLIEFKVNGNPPGSLITMGVKGGTVDVTWEVASVTIPISRVELVVNGEIRESVSTHPNQASGSWVVNIDKSSWLALLIRGNYEDKPEIIAAHSSPVIVKVEGTALLAAADAVTILEQIEGALAYVDTVGPRAKDVAYKRMRLVLTSAHRNLHNRMHNSGFYHDHTPVTNHSEHYHE